VLGHLDGPACFWPDWQPYFSRFTPPGPRNPNHRGTRPTLLNSIFHTFIDLPCPVIFSFHSFIIFIACHRTRKVHTAIELYDCLFSPFIFTFFYCVYNSYTHFRSFAALQHLNSAGISLEFYIYWHMLPGLSTYQWILLTRINGKLLHIMRMVNQGLQVSMMFIIPC